MVHLDTPIGDNQLMHGGPGPAGRDPVNDYGLGVTWAQTDLEALGVDDAVLAGVRLTFQLGTCEFSA